MHELIAGSEGYGWLMLLAVALAWAGALVRVSAPGRDYRSASGGGWLLLGGVGMVCLASATLVPPHTPVLLTLYAGIGPALVGVLGMAGLVVVDGLADWLSPPLPGPRRAIRWGGMTLILAGIGLLMEIRSALAIHMGTSHAVTVELIAATERWFQLARGGGGAAAIIGLALIIDGVSHAVARSAAREADPNAEDQAD